MSHQYIFLFVFLSGFAALTASTNPCKEHLVEGTSCTITIQTNNGTPDDIQWVYTPFEGKPSQWKKKITAKTKTNPPAGKMEEDGSLTFDSFTQKNVGTYKYNVFDAVGKQIGLQELTIKVYAKVPKPTVQLICSSELSAVVTCHFGNSKDLNVSWYKENNIMQKENNAQLILISDAIQEYKQYSCKVSNPATSNQSDPITVRCQFTLFGFDFWVMVGILAGGGVLLLLLICVLITCACRSCRQRRKQQRDEEELRLHDLQAPANIGTNRSKNTARGQPAPPIPQDETMNCSPCAETPPQPKAQARARPPPPPQDDDDEYPPPLPRPRNKQQRNKRNQEPYRPME